MFRLEKVLKAVRELGTKAVKALAVATERRAIDTNLMVAKVGSRKIGTAVQNASDFIGVETRSRTSHHLWKYVFQRSHVTMTFAIGCHQSYLEWPHFFASLYQFLQKV